MTRGQLATVQRKQPLSFNPSKERVEITTYHIGNYTYEEVLNGLTMDREAGEAAHEVMNDLRQNPEHRNFFKERTRFRRN